jgi:hypothetical protein
MTAREHDNQSVPCSLTNATNFQKMKIRISFIVLAVIFLPIAAVLTHKFYPVWRGNPPSVDTVVFCQRVRGAIIVTLNEDNNIFNTAATADSNSMNRNVATFLKRNAPVDVWRDDFVSPDGMFHDRFGAPLLFSLTHSSSFERLNPKLKDRYDSLPFAIWSAGPNGVDESGFGDDIF